MNTDDPKQDAPQSTLEPTQDSSNDQNLTDLVGALQSVDTDSPEASSNATSIDDNNGGRIELDEDSPNVIKK